MATASQQRYHHSMRTLLSIGHGYSAQALARQLLAEDWRIIGTSRQIRAESGMEMLVWPGDDLRSAICEASHVLISVAPGDNGDPALRELGPAIASADPEWVGYLSTTGVYGDHGGGWVDEATPLTPTTRRGRARAEAEAGWQALGLPLHIFRLAGIYGPGRGPFEKVREGRARRIIKEGQVFSRIHVDDIAEVLCASIRAPAPGIYNVCDDLAAPPQDVITYAADLLGVPRPPEVRFEDADLSPMARSFYAESKRVRNDRIKHDLGVTLRYPTYREGLRALLREE